MFRPDSCVISCHMNLNMDYLLELIWDKLALVRVYTKKVLILDLSYISERMLA
jgi:ribosome-interacting GTPase 1